MRHVACMRQKRNTVNSFNPAPMGLDRYQNIKYSGLSDSIYISQSALREHEHQLFSFHHKKTKRLSFFFIIISPVTRFYSERIAVNQLYNTLSSCTNLGSFSVVTSKGPSHFNLMP